ncbi:MAG: AMP-binding protein [Archangiaceae bacterium]|nr:AMP-binding protein [Archangiaceae bacterium]
MSTRLVASQLVGALPLADGRWLLSHVLGLKRLVCSAETVELWRAFGAPRSPEGLGADPALLDRLREADLLQPEGPTDLQRIRARFAARPDPERPAAGLGAVLPPWPGLAPDGPGRALDVTFDTRLWFSPTTALAPLERGLWLALHPLGELLYVDQPLVDLARAFAAGQRVGEVLERLGVAPAQGLEACRLLTRRALLWRAPNGDAQLAAAELPESDGASLPQVLERRAWQWSQRLVPYRLAELVPATSHATVTLVGYCQGQLWGEALRTRAQRAGVDLETRSYLDASELPEGEPTSLVVLTPTWFAAELYQALGVGDLEAARAAVGATLARVDESLSVLRDATLAPVVVVSFGRPGLLGEARQHHRLAAHRVLAELNGRLATLAEAWPAVQVLDEELALEAAPFALDDAFNAVAHHSTVALDRWFHVGRGAADWSTRWNGEGQQALPDSTAGARAALALADACLDALTRAHAVRPLRLVCFEPDQLLWRGRLADREAPHPDGLHFYSGVWYLPHQGLNEALEVLAGRGVKLAAISRTPAEVLKARWVVPGSPPYLLAPADLAALEGGAPPRAALDRVLRETGVSEEQALWVDLTGGEPPEGFRGQRYAGDAWGLRRFLLTSPALQGPALDAPPHPGAAGGEAGRAASSAAAAPVEPPPVEAVHAAVDAALAERLGRPLSRAQWDEDLRGLGLDSLGSLELVARLEEALGARFDDRDFVDATLFRGSGLAEAAVRATRRRPAPAHRDPLGAATRAQFSERTFAALLQQHRAAPQVPWILKLLREGSPNDCRYVSWPELMEHAEGWAALYRRRGLGEGEVVAVTLPQGLDLVAAYLGAMLGGQVPACLPAPSPKLPAAAFFEWFSRVLTKSQAALVVCTPELEALIASAERTSPSGPPRCSEVPPPSRASSEPARDPGSSLLLQYSSGTTGTKKTVLLTHRQVLGQLYDLSRALQLGEHDVVVSWLPLYHDMGLVGCLLLSLATSTPLVLMSPFDWVKRPELLHEQVAAERGTLCWLPNFAFAHLARRAESFAAGSSDLSSLRAVVSCSEPVLPLNLERYARAFAAHGLRRQALGASYAMAETTFAVTQTPVGRPPRTFDVDAEALSTAGVARLSPPGAGPRVRLVSSGRPLQGTRVQLVDDTRAPVPDGTLGEIRVKSPSQIDGYWRDSEASAGLTHDGWLHTGDLGVLLDGELVVLGRKKELMIIGGQNVYPHDVEECVTAVPGVLPGRAVAFGVHDDRLGTERLVVLAEVDPGLGEAALPPLAQTVRERLMAVLAVTASDVQLYRERTLVKSTSGKPSRAKNRELYLARDSGDSAG